MSPMTGARYGCAPRLLCKVKLICPIISYAIQVVLFGYHAGVVRQKGSFVQQRQQQQYPAWSDQLVLSYLVPPSMLRSTLAEVCQSQIDTCLTPAHPCAGDIRLENRTPHPSMHSNALAIHSPGPSKPRPLSQAAMATTRVIAQSPPCP